MRRTAPALLVVLLVGFGRVSAQAPVVTPAGDPSVRSDTIYALAVKAGDYPEESIVVLLDDGVIVQNADGTATATYRTVAQALTREAVDDLSEHTFGYDGEKERFRLNWIRVLRPDGTVISDKPLQEQTSNAPVPEQSPIYTDRKRVRVSLAGVEPGSIVDFSYTTETLTPILPDDLHFRWTIAPGRTVRRSRLVVDVPVGYDLKITERHLKHAAKVTQRNGRRVMEWTAADLPWIQPETFVDYEAADVFEGLTFGGPLTWEKLGAWYAALARDRYLLDPEVIAAADQVTAAATGDRAKLEALHRWVAQDIRYISLSLGLGGYQPRTPLEVLRTRSGDCKDKATLFVALARRLGFEAHPVLLNLNGGVDEKLPSIQQFNHVIAAVELDGRWTYLDLTADMVPFGEVPPPYQGEFGLIVFDDGRVERTTFPLTAPEGNWIENRIVAEVTAEGAFTATVETRAKGAMQYSLREAFMREYTDRERGEIANTIAARVMQGGRGDSLIAFDGRDLKAEPYVKVTMHAERALQRSGAGWVFRLPIPNLANPSLVTQLEEERDRRTMPIDVDEASGAQSVASELVLKLPTDWVAELPEDVTVEDPVWGRYSSHYEQNEGVVTVRRSFTGARGSQPKEAFPSLIAWLEAIAVDDVPILTVRPGD